MSSYPLSSNRMNTRVPTTRRAAGGGQKAATVCIPFGDHPLKLERHKKISIALSQRMTRRDREV